MHVAAPPSGFWNQPRAAPVRKKGPGPNVVGPGSLPDSTPDGISVAIDFLHLKLPKLTARRGLRRSLLPYRQEVIVQRPSPLVQQADEARPLIGRVGIPLNEAFLFQIINPPMNR